MPKDENNESLLQRACTLYLRAISLFFIVFAIRYWLQIVGFYDGELNRFDTMPEHWRIAVGVLSVLYPVAALGLWGLFSWGVVLWIAALIMEVGMYAGFSHLFGEAQMLVMFHLSAFAIYLVIRIVMFLLARRAAKASQ